MDWHVDKLQISSKCVKWIRLVAGWFVKVPAFCIDKFVVGIFSLGYKKIRNLYNIIINTRKTEFNSHMTKREGE